MPLFRQRILPVLLAGSWIGLSEFIRNEWLLKDYWVDHYAQLGLDFPDAPINGMVWGLWSLWFAVLIFVLYRKFSFWQTVLWSWLAGFLLMWIVTANLGVLPYGILPYALPLSILEVVVAAWIIRGLER
jgi:hypothetical protein